MKIKFKNKRFTLNNGTVVECSNTNNIYEIVNNKITGFFILLYPLTEEEIKKQYYGNLCIENNKYYTCDAGETTIHLNELNRNDYEIIKD
jgi:hypothetical protein